MDSRVYAVGLLAQIVKRADWLEVARLVPVAAVKEVCADERVVKLVTTLVEQRGEMYLTFDQIDYLALGIVLGRASLAPVA